LLLSLVEPCVRPLLIPARLRAFPEFLRGRKTWDEVERVGPAEATVTVV